MRTRRLLLITGILIFYRVYFLCGNPLCPLCFEGNQQLPNTVLSAELYQFNEALKTVSPDFFAEHMRVFYKQYGFLEAQIKAARDKDGLKFSIVEGPALLVDQVQIVSCDPLRMRDNAKIYAHEAFGECCIRKPFEYKNIEKGCRKFEEKCMRMGFSQCRIKKWRLKPLTSLVTCSSCKKCILELDIFLGPQYFVESVRVEGLPEALCKNAFTGSPWERLVYGESNIFANPFDLFMIREQRVWLLRFFHTTLSEDTQVNLSPSWTITKNRVAIVWTCTATSMRSAKSMPSENITTSQKKKRHHEIFVRGGLQAGGDCLGVQLFPFLNGSFCSYSQKNVGDAWNRIHIDTLFSEYYSSGLAQYQTLLSNGWMSGISLETTYWRPWGYHNCGLLESSGLFKSGLYARTLWEGGNGGGCWRYGAGLGFEIVGPPCAVPRVVCSTSLSYSLKKCGVVEGIFSGIIPLCKKQRGVNAFLKIGLQGEWRHVFTDTLFGVVRGRVGVIGGGYQAEIHPYDRFFLRRGSLLSGLHNTFGEQMGSFGFCPYTRSSGGTGLFQGLLQLSTPLSSFNPHPFLSPLEVSWFIEGGRLWRSCFQQSEEKTAVIGVGLHVKTGIGTLCSDIGWDLCCTARPRNALVWFVGWDRYF